MGFRIKREKKIYIYRVMLTSALRALVNNPIKESFYGGKKTINVLIFFFYVLIGYFNNLIDKFFLSHLVDNWLST